MENQYIIKGGTPLNGEVTIGGAKNAALGILAAAIMADETVVIDNLPNVRDINVLLTAIESIGATVKRIGPHVVSINGSTINDMTIDYDSIRKIRASYYLLGALLGKYKKAQVALPGGCEIGSRPIDLHLKGFRALGATVSIEHGMINTSADELVGNHIFLDTVSVGATINIMLAACMAEGKTVIENGAFGSSSYPTLDYRAGAQYNKTSIKLRSVKKSKNKYLTTKTKWVKVKGVSGYEVKVATDKKFKKNTKTVKVTETKTDVTVKIKVKDVKKIKKVYVKVTPYTFVNGTKVYGIAQTDLMEIN